MRRLVAAGLMCGVLYLGAIAAFGLAQRPKPADLIVVFGNAVAAGAPSSRLRARLDTGAALYRAGLAPSVLVSGAIERNGGDEPAVMAAYLASQGIPAAAILLDPTGVNSTATARTAETLEPEGRVIVVTQWFHIPRAMLAMRLAGVSHVSAAWPRFAEWRDIPSLLREGVALPVYAVSSAYRRMIASAH